ncbi:hypothetical protein TNCV_2656801 [Trichonephila clavipes]|nr:hypothetical protein TNCV_2656801 [Trichonephila clavipes]
MLMKLPLKSGFRSLVVRSWTHAWRVISSSPNATEYLPCRGLMHLKSVETQNFPFDVVWNFAEDISELRYHPHHLIMIQNYEVCRQ